MSTQQDVEFRTADGILLRGRLYAGAKRGPGIAMCPGFNAVKEMGGVPAAAEAFQAAGCTALLFDPRSVGLSDGMPRNDIDPFAQVDDFSDALTFLASQASVDPAQLGVWGMSLGGAVALSSACFDTRVRFAIGVCPAAGYEWDAVMLPKVLAKVTKDRESRVKGNEPYYVPMLNDRGENPAGFNFGVEKELALRILSARDDTMATRTEIAPNHVNRTTVQTYQRLLMWMPAYMWQEHLRVPTLFVVPEQDQLIGVEKLRAIFESLSAPKRRLHIEPGRGHLDILNGDNLPDLMKVQTDFVSESLGSAI